MAFTEERFLLLPIGAGAPAWDAATVSVNHGLLGSSSGDDVLTARHDRGAFLYLGGYPIDAQNETDYDGSGSNGTFVDGSGYTDSDTITLSDGTTVAVDVIGGGGAVIDFTVDSSASTGASDGDTLAQSSVSPGSGTGFTLTLGSANDEYRAPKITFDLGASPPLVNFIFVGGAVVTGTGLSPEDLVVGWESDDDVAFGNVTSWGSQPYPRRKTGAADPRLDMTQPNLGVTDAELPAIMNQGRLHSYFKGPSFPDGEQERYHRLSINHLATPATDQRLYLPIVQGGWGWQPDGAQWAPGSLQRRQIQRQGGDVLRGWQFTAQAVAEDAALLKLQEWFASSGNRNRAVFWQDCDRDERFIQNCGMVQVLDMSMTQRAGTFKSASVASIEQSETYEVAFNLAERFNDEKDT